MGYIGSQENGLNTFGKRDLFYRDSQNLIGTGIWAKLLLGFGIRGTPFTPTLLADTIAMYWSISRSVKSV